MDLIGKWKVKEIFRFSLEGGMEWKTLEDLEAQGEDEDELATYKNSVMIFYENGTAENLMILPADCTQEQIEAAIAEGHEIHDGMMVLDRKEWKTEDGKNLYNTGNSGEILGEEVSPWVELTEVDDMIELQFVRYARAE
ncbi:MAG: hypothetical protein PUC05_01665 [Firmicutes bacterium]|nr:hypothetical protein [Bacillota bacterium]